MYKVEIKWLNGSRETRYYEKLSNLRLNKEKGTFGVEGKDNLSDDFNYDLEMDLIDFSYEKKTMNMIGLIKVENMSNEKYEIVYEIGKKQREEWEKIQEIGVKKLIEFWERVVYAIGNVWSEFVDNLDYWLEKYKEEQNKKGDN